jgi:hypothetical protein
MSTSRWWWAGLAVLAVILLILLGCVVWRWWQSKQHHRRRHWTSSVSPQSVADQLPDDEKKESLSPRRQLRRGRAFYSSKHLPLLASNWQEDDDGWFDHRQELLTNAITAGSARGFGYRSASSASSTGRGLLATLLLPKHELSATADQISQANAHRDRILRTCGDLKSFSLFNPELDDDKEYIEINNCYYWAFSDLNLGLSQRWRKKPQPGQMVDLQPLRQSELTCDRLVQRILLDHPTAVWVPISSPNYGQDAPCRSYKAYFMLDDQAPVGKRDYHFLREGIYAYTHKPGSTPVSQVDASGQYIVNPDLCNWDYSAHGGPRYTIRGYFIVQHTNDQMVETPAHPARKQEQESFPERLPAIERGLNNDE